MVEVAYSCLGYSSHSYCRPVAVQAQSVAGQAYQDPGLQAADTEMRILEASIDKISELLAVAFGDAGVDIIAENMRCMGGLDPMVPGNRTVSASSATQLQSF